MEKGNVHIYTGAGRGKSSAALGRAVQAAVTGKKSVIIQFLKGLEESEFLKRMEPEVKLFRFEKSEHDFLELSEREQSDEVQNIKNGLNFAKKVLSTGECDILVLDEVLGLVDNKIITEEEIQMILEAKTEEVEVIMTGISMSDSLCLLADEISKIERVKFKVFE